MPRTPTQTIPFTLDAGHVLLDLGGVKTLLDTGSQVSFGDVPAIDVLGHTFAIPPDLLGKVTVGKTVEGLRRFTPVAPSFTFQALLGLDILAGLTLELDWVACTLTLSGKVRPNATRKPGPAPSLLEVAVNGSTYPGFVDTGAWRTYLTSTAAASASTVGRFSDYNPFIGAIEPDLVRARVALRGQEVEVEAGKATGVLETAIRSTKGEVLIGTDVLIPMGKTVMTMPTHR